MKKSSKINFFTSLLMCFFLTGFSSCKDDENKKKEYDPNQPIILTVITRKREGLRLK